MYHTRTIIYTGVVTISGICNATPTKLHAHVFGRTPSLGYSARLVTRH
jgi:hypothetical protein